MSKSDIDSFFTESGKRFPTRDGEQFFSNRLIVSTTDKWSSEAEKALENQTTPVERLRVQDLDESPVDWSEYSRHDPSPIKLQKKRKLREHQQEALDATLTGFETSERGKLIIACGTGKTFASLRIAESLVPKGGRILFLAPSISLVSQTLREWTAHSETPFHAFAVCSDSQVGKDHEDMRTHDLAYPATTNPIKLAEHSKLFEKHDPERRTVIFSTYQSIQVVADAQLQGLGEFDLVVCDEAHRTTGVTVADSEASDFVKVHDNSVVKACKRPYMTATPRIFGGSSKQKAEDKEAVVYSMDDPDRFGPEFYRIGFGQAVRWDLLMDYRVLLVAVNEDLMPSLTNAYRKRPAKYILLSFRRGVKPLPQLQPWPGRKGFVAHHSRSRGRCQSGQATALSNKPNRLRSGLIVGRRAMRSSAGKPRSSLGSSLCKPPP